MNYQDSKKFYQDQWHSPFGRVRKIALPILVSMIAVLGVGGMSIIATSYFEDAIYLKNSDFLQLFCAVIMGTGTSLIFHYFRLHRLSQFQLIKVKINPQEKRYD